MNEKNATTISGRRWRLILCLGACLAAPNLAAADSETLCVGPWFGVPKRVIFSGSCPKGEIAVPLSSGGQPFDYKIGDTGPGGGIVFFVDYHDQYPGFDYLEASPEDLVSMYAWGCSGFPSPVTGVSGWGASAVGRGQANTDAILAANCGGDAAQTASDYELGGKTDWFLLSEGELMLMYTNLRHVGKGAFGYESYWSSTENLGEAAWYQSFIDGSQNYTLKRRFMGVRPIRAF